ncbi:MAG TPA: ABC-2 family transporter protein [bacterium]|nr:ABC-2 family transporter protein [bacterium]
MEKQSRIKAYARFLGASFSANFLAVIEYRANFLLQVFGMMLNNGAFALFWGVLLGRTGGIGGYGFTDVMFVWAVVSSAFGLAHVLFGNIRNLGRIIMQGELDLYLLQPKDVFLNVLASKTIVSAWGDLAYGLIVAALLPDFGVGRFFLFCVLTATGAVIFAATFAAAESLAFFMGNSQAISGALSEFLLSFSLYPETIFDKGMRWVFYTILPSGFIAFVPLAVYRGLDWRLVPVLIAVAILYAGLSYALFRAGLRRYESGNQMGARV